MPRKGSPCPCEPDVLAYSGLPPVPEPRTPKDLPGGEEQGTAMLWQMWAAFHEHLARIEAKVDRLAPPPEPEPEPPPVPPLVRALGAAFGASGFTSREAWHRATSDPALWQALQETGITGTHHLGRWLGNHQSAGVQRSTEERDGCLWHCDPRGVSAPTLDLDEFGT